MEALHRVDLLDAPHRKVPLTERHECKGLGCAGNRALAPDVMILDDPLNGLIRWRAQKPSASSSTRFRGAAPYHLSHILHEVDMMMRQRCTSQQWLRGVPKAKYMGCAAR